MHWNFFSLFRLLFSMFCSNFFSFTIVVFFFTIHNGWEECSYKLFLFPPVFLIHFILMRIWISFRDNWSGSDLKSQYWFFFLVYVKNYTFYCNLWANYSLLLNKLSDFFKIIFYNSGVFMFITIFILLLRSGSTFPQVDPDPAKLYGSETFHYFWLVYAWHH